MTEHTLTKADLDQFYGTEVWYKHGLVKNILYTEGVQYVAEHGGAYWLIDEIAFLQSDPKVMGEPFQVWILTVAADHKAQLICEDGDGYTIFKKDFGYTDFPLDEIEFYVTNNVILLPGEY